jgi:Uma2 family endonuclease
MVLALPDDGNRYELFDEELLVTPAPTPRHQWAALAFYQRLFLYLRGTGIGVAGLAPADLRLEGTQATQPDVFVVRSQEDGSLPARWEAFGIPLLVVEILSPGSAHADRIVKRRRYQRAGVPEYWVVDLDAKAVERWRPDDLRPEIIDDTVTWQPDPSRPALTISLVEVFAELPTEPEAG